jgi:hypothetical protein
MVRAGLLVRMEVVTFSLISPTVHQWIARLVFLLTQHGDLRRIFIQSSTSGNHTRATKRQEHIASSRQCREAQCSRKNGGTCNDNVLNVFSGLRRHR